jgi:actin-related protein 5
VLAQNIFLTGRHTLYPNLDTRLQNSLVALLPTTPYGSAVRVRRANDPRFDAWRGMARWCLERGEERKEASVVSYRERWYGRGDERDVH